MFTDTNTSPNERALSLFELNQQVKRSIKKAFPENYWVQAETSDVRMNASSGHCYLELIEKNPKSGQIVAKIRATVWANTFRMLEAHFEQETGQRFQSNLKVLVNVTVEFHELYGFSLTIVDIDPTYTLGDMARKRLEIIRQLQEEGIFTLNKELPFPTLPQRIAVITSATAAGYEDFMEQINGNKAGFPFYIRLFPALMQGERTESSIIAALDHIYNHVERFDVVVIIRGGGATSDLNSFDSYLLAANCAQFPLPIITGIGHERDDTVLDLVAHTRMKTPTAVAEFLIGKMQSAADHLSALYERIYQHTTQYLLSQHNRIQLLSARFPTLVSGRLERNRSALELIGNRLKNGTGNLFVHQKKELELTEQFIRMASPEYILKKGYSLTLKEGKIIKHASDLENGDQIVTRFADGEVTSQITRNS